MNSSFFTPLRRFSALILPSRTVVLPLYTPAAAVIIACASVGLAPALDDTASLAAQCYACDKGECANGTGAARCREEHAGGTVTCITSGGCVCVKVVRNNWPDTQVCTPVEEGASEGVGMASASSDVRYVHIGEQSIALHRVTKNYLAAKSCQNPDGEWAILGRELPTGEIKLVTNPLLIRAHRWVFSLSKQDHVADTQD